MVAWLRQFIEPAKTTSLLRRHRTDIGGPLVGLVIIGVAAAAILRLSRQSGPSLSATPLNVFLLCATALIMAGTAHHWAPFVPGVLLTRGVVMNFVLFTFGLHPAHATTREQLGLLLYSLIAGALTWRFLRFPPAMTTIWDRVGLTFFTLVSLKYVVDPSQSSLWRLMGGLTGLFVAWFAARLRSKEPRSRPKRAPAPSASV